MSLVVLGLNLSGGRTIDRRDQQYTCGSLQQGREPSIRLRCVAIRSHDIVPSVNVMKTLSKEDAFIQLIDFPLSNSSSKPQLSSLIPALQALLAPPIVSPSFA